MDTKSEEMDGQSFSDPQEVLWLHQGTLSAEPQDPHLQLVLPHADLQGSALSDQEFGCIAVGKSNGDKRVIEQKKVTVDFALLVGFSQMQKTQNHHIH